MPRDEHAVVEPSTITLPGFRRARVVPADDAGEVRLHVLDGDWVDRLYSIGALDRDQRAAGLMIATLFEACGIRTRSIGAIYDGPKVDSAASAGTPLENMTGRELKAWYKLHRLLSTAPLFSRGEVEAVVIHGLRPVSVGRLKAGLAAIAKALQAER